jgi:hypothetical protein
MTEHPDEHKADPHLRTAAREIEAHAAGTG